jgi:glycosyltransferase involved in cell wall biosynthesis
MAFSLAPVAREQLVPSVADLHDIESLAQQRTAVLEGSASGPWAVAKRVLAARKIRAAERAVAAAYAQCAVTSEHDAAALHGVVGGRAKALVVPNGVDTAYFQPSGAIAPQPDTLVFTGLMAHPPNVDGVRYFCSEVLPLIWGQRPAARLLVVGASPPPAILALDGSARGRVRVLGAVPDTRPYLAQGSVAVVPLRSGSGTRLKILEALAMERPVVSTTIGAEGLETIHGRHLLIADDAASFAAAVLRLLQDQQLAARLAAEGRSLVERRYRWEAIGAAWQKSLHYLVAQHATAQGNRGWARLRC